MAAATVGITVRRERGDALLVALALAHGAALAAWPSAPLIALGLWWNSNTVAHYFLHRPFFPNTALNRLFSAYLSVLLGIPQALWRDRHLAHHAGVPWRVRLTSQLVVEAGLVLGVWALLLAVAPVSFLTAYLPGYAAGLALCYVHGHYEHARSSAISHYGALYNLLLFNDGYHAEHHARPALPWTDLPGRRDPGAATSRWPAPLRWLEAFSLEGLERLALRCGPLRRWVLEVHKRALGGLLTGRSFETVVIVGGGLFPRSALALRDLLPAARITIIDQNAGHLETARRLAPPGTEFIHRQYRAGHLQRCDLAVLPLGYNGDRETLYHAPPAPVTVIHDWIWRPRGESRVVSLLLLKRVNLIRSTATESTEGTAPTPR
jgi:hypothetical protein